MGMFDTFVGEFKCHYCGKMVEFEKQTKNYDCCLQYFKVGDYIDKANANYYYEFDYYCPKCNSQNQLSLKIKNGKFEEIINSTEFENGELEKMDNELNLKSELIKFGKSKGRIEILKLFDEVLREI